MTHNNGNDGQAARGGKQGAGLRARTDRNLIRSTHRSERFVLVELDAPAATAKHRREPVNIAFVLDRSGSMAGQKIELARKAVEVAIDRLLPEDRFAVVAYDDRIDVVIESTPASREAKDGAIRQLRGIDARGMTNLGGGWLKGAEQVALHQAAAGSGKGIHRVLLLTDGLANQGITDPAELARHAGELRARGIGTSTFGVGEDFDEALLQGMADAGGGHFYYIERPEQITDLIASEVGELLEIVARDAAIEVTAPDGMTINPLSPYKFEQRGSRFLLLLGDLVAGQHVEAVIRIRFGYGPIGSEVGVLVGATDRDGVLAAAGCAPVAIGWQYADDFANDAQPRDRSVDRRVAGLFAAQVRQEAVKLNRLGDFEAAVKELHGVASRIKRYAGRDAELHAIADALLAEEQQWAAPAPESLRKVAFASASYSMRSRGPEGKAGR
jgi:Ca-activated chloride channel family protein